ncbi:MAG: hypothetical protein ACRD3V_02890, partial [Vicinamibacteria bacterium]
MRRFVGGLVLLCGCGGSSPEPGVVRLVDEFGSVQVENASTAGSSIQPTEWRFDDPAAAAGWKAGVGVQN